MPGNEHAWNEPMNWINRRVPGWFDTAVIPFRSAYPCFYPIIDEFVNDVAELLIEEGAKLFISRYGRLSIDGLGKKRIGINNFGELNVRGELTVQRTTKASVRNHGLLVNAGSIALDKSEKKGIVHEGTSCFENYGELLFI